MKKRLGRIDAKRILKHIFFWCGFLGILFLLSGTHALPLDFWLVDLPVLFIYVYVTAYLLLPYFLKRKKFFFLIITFFIFSLLISFLRLKNYDFFYFSMFAPGPVMPHDEINFSSIILNAKDFSFALFVFLAFKYTQSWLQYENNRMEIENTQLESELELIKTQIDPHFIFNTLNNIYSLSVTDPGRTRLAIKKLWGIMDFLVHEVDHEEIRIEKELNLIHDYVELERLRYGERLTFDFCVDENLKEYRILPLIMYPFVENSFNHSMARDPGYPWIKIRILEKDNFIRFIAESSRGEEFRDTEFEKEITKTLIRIRKRLDYYLPGRYQLQTSANKNEASVQLDIAI